MRQKDSCVNAGEPTPLRRSPRFHHQKDTSEPHQPKTPVPKFTKMRQKDSCVNAGEPTPLRRSPRFHHQKDTSEPHQPKTPVPKSRSKAVCSSNPTPSSVKNASSRTKQSPKKSTKSSIKSRNCVDNVNTVRKSCRLNNKGNRFLCLRRSPRFSNQICVVDEHIDGTRQGTKKLSNSVKLLGNGENLASGSRKSARVNDCVQNLKRSHRVLKKPKFVEVERVESDSNISVEQVAAYNAKVEPDSSKKSLDKSYKVTVDISANHGGLVIELSESKARNEARNKTGVERKRKRGEDDKNTMKGWTKEQELALQRAYFSANPTPHFWKKVSKLVPGKSAQECFDRIHQDHMTPPQPRPRSRAKIINSSPHQHFSLSASKLLKPFDKVRRSNSAGLKNYLTQKSVKMLLKCHHKVDDQVHEGDLFSVLEPNMDFPANACHPSEVLSTPKQLKEKQGLMQSAGTSSSSHKKSLSRFSRDIVSPPVLKQVKNRVLHEKYINQLRSREARRRASTAKADKCKTGKIVGEKSSAQKRDVVKAAKNALVSEARDAINKFQHLQANFIDNSDEDEDYGIGVESKDEEAEDEIE